MFLSCWTFVLSHLLLHVVQPCRRFSFVLPLGLYNAPLSYQIPKQSNTVFYVTTLKESVFCWLSHGITTFLPSISVLESWPSEIVFFLFRAWVFAKLKCPKSIKTYQTNTKNYTFQKKNMEFNRFSTKQVIRINTIITKGIFSEPTLTKLHVICKKN